MLFAATTPPRLPTLILLTGLSTLSLNLFLPSLAVIADDFDANYALVNLAVGGYLGVSAAVQLIVGPLSDRYGRRPVMLGALTLFAVASAGCALAPDVGTFLAFRVLQTAVIAGWAVSQAVVRDMLPPQEAASRLGYVAMAMAVAPMLGPMVGGILQEAFGWRASFILFLSLGSLLFLLVWVDMGETNRQKSATFAAQFRAYPDLFASRRFWGFALCSAFSTAAFYSFLSGVPLVAVGILDLTPTELGIYIGSITGGFAFGSFLSGRYSKRFQLTTMMIAGRLVACTGLTVGLILAMSGIVSVPTLFGATLCVGIGNGVTMPSSNAGALSVRPQLAGSAAGLSGSLTVGIGAVLTMATGTAVSAASASASVLLAIMLGCSAIGLTASLWVLSIDRREGALAK